VRAARGVPAKWPLIDPSCPIIMDAAALHASRIPVRAPAVAATDSGRRAPALAGGIRMRQRRTMRGSAPLLARIVRRRLARRPTSANRKVSPTHLRHGRASSRRHPGGVAARRRCGITACLQNGAPSPIRAPAVAAGPRAVGRHAARYATEPGTRQVSPDATAPRACRPRSGIPVRRYQTRACIVQPACEPKWLKARICVGQHLYKLVIFNLLNRGAGGRVDNEPDASSFIRND
jgi:hypothetical protein